MRRALKRRDVFWLATGDGEQHPAVVVEVFPDRIALATGTGADEPGETTDVSVDGQAAEKMGLNKLTRFYKMHVTVWNEATPIEANVVATCIPSLFPKLVVLVEDAVIEHRDGKRTLKTLPRGTAVAVDLVAHFTKKRG